MIKGMATDPAGCRGSRPAQALRRPRGGQGHRLPGRGGRGLRPAGPQRRGEDDDRRDPRGLPVAHAAAVSVLGHDPERRERALRERVGIVLQSTGMYRHLTVCEALTHWSRLYPRAARRRRGDRARGLAGSRDVRTRRCPAASFAGWTSRWRCRRSRAGLPRRADHRLRPRGAARGVGHDPFAGATGQDHPAHHPLPRRGAGARRPRRDHQGRPDRRRGRPGELGTGGSRYRVRWREPDGDLVERETDDPTALLHEPPRRRWRAASCSQSSRSAARPGGRLSRPHRRRARARRGRPDA